MALHRVRFGDQSMDEAYVRFLHDLVKKELSDELRKTADEIIAQVVEEATNKLEVRIRSLIKAEDYTGLVDVEVRRKIDL